MSETAARRIVYRFQVAATLPLTNDPGHPDFYTEAVATDPKQQRTIERKLFQLLRRFEAECDVELLDYTIEGE